MEGVDFRSHWITGMAMFAEFSRRPIHGSYELSQFDSFLLGAFRPKDSRVVCRIPAVNPFEIAPCLLSAN
jgi:hypothetical protein